MDEDGDAQDEDGTLGWLKEKKHDRSEVSSSGCRSIWSNNIMSPGGKLTFPNLDFLLLHSHF